MSLLSTDIAKVKRLSLREVKLPTTERRVEPITPILVERPPTDEEIAYSKLVAINQPERQEGEIVAPGLPIEQPRTVCLDFSAQHTSA